MSNKHMEFSNNQQLSLYKLLQWLHLFASHVTINCRPIPPIIFHQYNLSYPSSNLLRNYPSSMRCPIKPEPEIANPSYQLHFIVSHSPTFQRPASWLYFIKNVSNSYYSLDYISPCLSHFKQLQWGFQLTLQLTILWTYHPLIISSMKHFLSSQHTHYQNKQQIYFVSILHTYPPLNLIIEINCLNNKYVWPSTYKGN